jgi:hypothetical protein
MALITSGAIDTLKTIREHDMEDAFMDFLFEVFCDGEPFAIWFQEPVNIRYVHELQHALKLCGINKNIVICEE